MARPSQVFARFLRLGDACFAVPPLACAFVAVHCPFSTAEVVVLGVRCVFYGGVEGVEGHGACFWVDAFLWGRSVGGHALCAEFGVNVEGPSFVAGAGPAAVFSVSAAFGEESCEWVVSVFEGAWGDAWCGESCGHGGWVGVVGGFL